LQISSGEKIKDGICLVYHISCNQSLSQTCVNHILYIPDIFLVTTLCRKKNIPDIFDCNLKTNYQMLIIFGKDIPDATCQQKTT